MVSNTGTYIPNSLFKNVTYDENNNLAIEFRDRLGRLVYTKTPVATSTDPVSGQLNCSFDFTDGGSTNNPSYSINTDNFNSTYFIYNTLGQLTYKLTNATIQALNSIPFFTEDPSDLVFQETVFAYHYDEKGRLIEEKKPGQGWEYFVYDKGDKLILRQDANLRAQDKWAFTKYDKRKRNIMSGVLSIGGTRAELALQSQNAFSEEERIDINTTLGYTNTSFPVLNFNTDNIYSINYYDFYDNTWPGPTNGLIFNNNIDGLLTGTSTLVMDGSNNYLLATTYYDNKYRIVQQQKQNILSGIDIYTNTYNFRGSLLESERSHSTSITSFETVSSFYYDKMGWLIDKWQQIGNDPVVHMVFNEYNKIGQLKTKKLHYDWILGSNEWFQEINYTYNERGWLRKINSAELDGDFTDAFGEELYYTQNDLTNSLFTIDGFDAIPQYNGNVSIFRWKQKAPQTDALLVPEHLYAYRYDNINRMTAGYYAQNTVASPLLFDENINQYKEWLSYDMNSNITSIDRNGPNGDNVDRLSYEYYDYGYCLRKITDDGVDHNVDFKDRSAITNEYLYDSNGNIIDDYNKQTHTTYNFFNLPDVINMSGYMFNNYYDGKGAKIKTVIDGKEHYYIDGVEYEDGNLLFVSTSEGRIRRKDLTALNTTDYVFDYYIVDHLSNVRAIISEEKTHDIREASMELNNDEEERSEFYYITETREDKPANMLLDNTIQDKVSLLNAGSGKTVGHSKVLRLMEGDEASIEVKSFFESASFNNNNSITTTTIINQLANSFVNSSFNLSALSPEQITQQVQSTQTSLAGNTALTTWLDNEIAGVSTGKPSAFLSYVFLNDKMQFVAEASGMIKVDDPDVIEKLEALNIKATETGYLFVSVSNFSDENVSFDNLMVVQNGAALLQLNHYYPYGMLIEDLSTESFRQPINKHKFTTKEYFDQNGLYEYDFGFRMYDPALARWRVQDPADQFDNPYTGIANNPAIHIDPDGAYAYQGITYRTGPHPVIAATANIAINFVMGGGLGSLASMGAARATAGQFASAAARGFISSAVSSYATSTMFALASNSATAFTDGLEGALIAGGTGALTGALDLSAGFNVPNMNLQNWMGRRVVSITETIIARNINNYLELSNLSYGIDTREMVEGGDNPNKPTYMLRSSANIVGHAGVGFDLLGAATLSGQGLYRTSKGVIKEINVKNLTKHSEPYFNTGKIIKDYSRTLMRFGIGIDVALYLSGDQDMSGPLLLSNTGVTVGTNVMKTALGPILGILYYGVSLAPGGWPAAMDWNSKVITNNRNIMGASYKY